MLSPWGSITTRSRFLDFTGEYVVHCHFLGHEDRGMMIGVQTICPSTPQWRTTVPAGTADNCSLNLPASPKSRTEDDASQVLVPFRMARAGRNAEQRPGRLGAERCLALLQTLALHMQTHRKGRQVQLPAHLGRRGPGGRVRGAGRRWDAVEPAPHRARAALPR
jgi:hypothetical protein